MGMKVFSRALALLLLGAVIAAPLAAPGLLASASAQPPAGCHDDSGKAPSPEPASHQCCQGAHHPAILQQFFTPRPSPQSLALIDLTIRFHTATGPRSFANQMMLSGDPPTVSPLRV
jgi:hypothetical protein